LIADLREYRALHEVTHKPHIKGSIQRRPVNRIFDKLFFREKHVCPSWLCFTFDNPLRKLIQDPYKILMPYIRTGCTVVDIGPGKGYFTIPMCKLVGKEGRVIAIDIQERMLSALQMRALKKGLASNLTTKLSRPNDFGVDVAADFVLAFWMVHEVPDHMRFFMNVKKIMKPQASLLIAEPVFHVTKKHFFNTLQTAQKIGFRIVDRPEISFSYAALLAL
jgi:2-polyprenyl-3-methyl-5-hydroxy-6-metoxy-1,4-benzoquinol methylase